MYVRHISHAWVSHVSEIYVSYIFARMHPQSMPPVYMYLRDVTHNDM